MTGENIGNAYAYFNDDLSGNVKFTTPDGEVDVPGELIIRIIARLKLSNLIRNLEQMDPRDLVFK